MRDANDTQTAELLPPATRGRGRPRTGSARSGAERQAAYRARLAENNVTVTINREDLATLKQALIMFKLTDSEHDKDSLERLTKAVFDVKTLK